jgi:Dyp-type peroxidase family
VVSLALNDIQGNILQGYTFPQVAYRFFGMPDAESGRAFLSELLPNVRNAERWSSATEPTIAMNVALTYSGLAALGLGHRELHDLPTAFSEPMWTRAPRELGDTGESAPSNWVDGLGDGCSHILVSIHGCKTEHAVPEFELYVEEVVARAEELGLSLEHSQDAGALYKQREHFGWADGFGQPSIDGTGVSQPGHGTPQKCGKWEDVKAGEFVHGYADEDDQICSETSAALLRNGTYMVYRKLYQDVALFRSALQEQAAQYAANVTLDPPLEGDDLVELLAAKIVGRWRDGVAIELQPQRPPTGSLAFAAAPDPDNDFRYFSADADGQLCPRGAHIRRTNPRDAFGGEGSMSKRHRIIRRGMPYGPALDPDEQVDDGEDRGLIFVCLNADLERQFEFIQSQWCNDGNAFGLGNDKDYLLGDSTGSGEATIQGCPPHIMSTPADVVVTRGSEYLLVPGIAALQRLAGQ